MEIQLPKMLFKSYLDIRPYRSRISGMLLQSLMVCDVKTFMCILARLDYLEDFPMESAESDGQAAFLKGKVLGKLNRTHYMTAAHQMENLQAHWASEANQEELSRLKALSSYLDKPLPKSEQHVIADQITGTLVGGFRATQAQRTVPGEWLVYGHWDNQNYYMDLAANNELADQRGLYERLLAGCPEFDICFAHWV